MSRIIMLAMSLLTISSSADDAGYYTGLNVPADLDRSNSPAMERYLSSLRTESVPDSFNAVSAGWIGKPEHQRSCGSCVVFTNIGLIETCIARTICTEEPDQCRVPDLSEQQALECGWNPPSVHGCDGAVPDAYVNWIIQRGGYMAEELEFPYDPEKLTHQCPDLVDDHPGVAITGENVAYDVDEETLKKLVYLNGAVQSSISAEDQSFRDYKGGIYEGCSTNITNHGVLLVGYGTEDGTDYWILRNSWGEHWGEEGFMRMRRGVGECGIGEMVLTVECQSVSGTTSAPYTTTTTAATFKQECDMKQFFGGYPLAASGLHLSLEANGVKYESTVDCQAGLCAPQDMTGIVNACDAICGADPCVPSDERSLINLIDVEAIIDSLTDSQEDEN